MSSAVSFLSVDDVLFLHEAQLARFGGGAGLRDPGLLESAVSQAEASFGGAYVHADLIEMAAAYLFHLVKNHRFVDGNKRVGLFALLAFLELNGVTLDEASDALYDLTMAVADGRFDKAAATAEVRRLVESNRS